MAQRQWSNAREAVACLAGACLGAALGGSFHGPLLAFVGAIFGAAAAAQATKLGRGPSALRPPARSASRTRRWV